MQRSTRKLSYSHERRVKAMERSSKFMDWDSQYYIDAIFPGLTYGILIKCPLHLGDVNVEIVY